MLKNILLVAGFCVAGMSGATASVLHISIDGYCNLFTLHQDGFQVYGFVSGCGKRSVEGGVSATVDDVPYIITNDQQDDHKHLYTWFFTPPVKKVGSWFLYTSNGKSQTQANSGTYTVDAPPTSFQAKDATAR